MTKRISALPALLVALLCADHGATGARLLDPSSEIQDVIDPDAEIVFPDRVEDSNKALPLDVAALDDDDNVDLEGGGDGALLLDDEDDPVAERVVDAMMDKTTKKGKDLEEDNRASCSNGSIKDL